MHAIHADFLFLSASHAVIMHSFGHQLPNDDGSIRVAFKIVGDRVEVSVRTQRDIALRAIQRYQYANLRIKAEKEAKSGILIAPKLQQYLPPQQKKRKLQTVAEAQDTRFTKKYPKLMALLCNKK
jgi:hypothetical protein